MKTQFFAVFLSAFLLCTGGSAQSINKEKLDKYFSSLEENNRFMGSVAIAKGGEIIYSKVIGFSDVASQKKSDAVTKYRIGSISKTFTAALVMKAVEEKKLSLTHTLDKYFPAIKNAQSITISNLMNHRSGIHNITDDPAYLQYNTTEKTQKEMLDLIVQAGSDFAPDAKASYSNSNYLLLTYILEKVYKKKYAEILSEKIIKPHGLSNTYAGGKTDLSKNESFSFRYDQEWKKEAETHLSIPAGAGAIVSTPSDILKFANALFNGQVISTSSLERMKEIRDNYGRGLFQYPFNEKRFYGHTGGIDGFSSVFGYSPEEKVSFAITSNGTATDINGISIVLLSEVFGVPYEIPAFSSYNPAPEELEQYVGIYSSSQLPLKITIAITEKGLTGQATGQPSFPLEASAKDVFRFDRAGVVIEFAPAQKQLTLKQGGGSFLFKKD